MAAPRARNTALLIQVLSVQTLANDIVDHVLKTTVTEPVELGDPLQEQAFIAAFNPSCLISVGLQPIALTRRFVVIRFIDRQSNNVGTLDTPHGYRSRMQTMEMVHPLTTSAIAHSYQQWALADYGLSRPLVRNVGNRLTNLRKTLVHEFEFATDDLDGHFTLNAAAYNRMHARLVLWVQDARQSNVHPTCEIYVIVTDRWIRRNNSLEMDSRANTPAEVATLLLRNLGTGGVSDNLGRMYRVV